jgi:hypothetical protein
MSMPGVEQGACHEVETHVLDALEDVDGRVTHLVKPHSR